MNRPHLLLPALAALGLCSVPLSAQVYDYGDDFFDETDYGLYDTYAEEAYDDVYDYGYYRDYPFESQDVYGIGPFTSATYPETPDVIDPFSYGMLHELNNGYDLRMEGDDYDDYDWLSWENFADIDEESPEYDPVEGVWEWEWQGEEYEGAWRNGRWTVWED